MDGWARFVSVGLFATTVGLSVACATSRIESAWRDPDATASALEFEKLVVVALVGDGALRRSAEDELVRIFQEGPRVRSGAMTVRPSYAVLEASDHATAERARERLKTGGYDGAVLVKFLSQEQRLTAEPVAMPGPGLWGYYGRVGAFDDPVMVRTDTIVRVQTSVYSVPDEKLLFSAVSHALNPRDVEHLMDDVARSVRAELRAQGLLP